jgi:hypothetical protein
MSNKKALNFRMTSSQLLGPVHIVSAHAVRHYMHARKRGGMVIDEPTVFSNAFSKGRNDISIPIFINQKAANIKILKTRSRDANYSKGTGPLLIWSVS